MGLLFQSEIGQFVVSLFSIKQLLAWLSLGFTYLSSMESLLRLITNIDLINLKYDSTKSDPL